MEYRRVLWKELLLQSAWEDRCASEPGQGRDRSRRIGPRHDRRSPAHLAVLPRSASRNLCTLDRADGKGCRRGLRKSVLSFWSVLSWRSTDLHKRIWGLRSVA